MDQKTYEQATTKLSKEHLELLSKKALLFGDRAWEAHKDAISLIDHKNDAVEGELALDGLLANLNLWIVALEELANAAKKVSKGADKALHTRGRDVDDEEDGEAVGPDAGGDPKHIPPVEVTSGEQRGKRGHPHRREFAGHANRSRRKRCSQRASKGRW